MKQSIKFFCAASALTVPCLAGCGGGGGSDPIKVSATPVVGLPHFASAALSNGLTATVLSGASVPVGGTITYTMTLTNSTTQPITFQPVHRDTCPWAGVGDALSIKDAGGGAVFPLGAALEVVGYGPSETLAPGKSVSGTLAVGSSKDQGQFSAAGQYVASVDFTVLTATGAYIHVTAGPLEVDAQANPALKGRATRMGRPFGASERSV